MRFLRFIKRFAKIDIGRNNFIALFMALICIVAGYLIVTMTNSSQKIFNEPNDIKAFVSDADNIEALKEKVKNDPEMLKRLRSSGFKDEAIK